ncbi:MAG: methylenetetrahydrofolate reductase [Alphaproteobacteria bacterium]|nr:methylenetetrahydrofolate reductase [Alphaproteobacteria bacterium]
MAEAVSRDSGRGLSASIELSPKGVIKDPSALRAVPEGTRIYLVDSGETLVAEWASACRNLVDAGLRAVPHIACRRLKGLEEIENRLHAMAEVGVDDALVIGGDIPRPLGPFGSSMDVLATGLFEQHGIRHIGVAGHPEGSPDIPPAVVVDALHWKIAFAARTGIQVRLVTQFGFDPNLSILWANRLRDEGVRLPIHLGVAGPTSMTKLLKFAALCGVRTSMSFALKRGAALASLLGNYEPEAHVRVIEQRVLAGEAPLIRQLHVYAFGGLAAATTWLTERGSWTSRRSV